MKHLKFLSEYLEPFYRLTKERVSETIVIFGSARIKKDGPLAHYYQAAYQLAFELTKWSLSTFGNDARRFVICTGGGGGIMEAANHGASQAGGPSIGLNIKLPHEQRPNPYVTPSLAFTFNYFCMRKLWFAKKARAIIIFPGGFGTLDELTEILTLVQTNKIDKSIPVILFGSSYWKDLINFETLIKYEMVEKSDLNLIQLVDSVPAAFTLITNNLQKA